MEINESNLTFSFADGTTVIKFDNTDFYRKVFNKLPGSKGVDIIADSNDMLQLIEIKNCTGHESENRWRISIDNSKLSSAPNTLEIADRDSLDIEIAKKVAATMPVSMARGQNRRNRRVPRRFLLFWQKYAMQRYRFRASR